MTAQPAIGEFAFRLDAHSGVPVYRQLIDQVQAAVATGTLRTGDQLPTVRRVAVDLSINPNTVCAASWTRSRVRARSLPTGRSRLHPLSTNARLPSW